MIAPLLKMVPATSADRAGQPAGAEVESAAGSDAHGGRRRGAAIGDRERAHERAVAAADVQPVRHLQRRARAAYRRQRAAIDQIADHDVWSPSLLPHEAAIDDGQLLARR